MKKEATKKSKLWIWLVVAIVALLAVAGVVLALVLGGGEQQADGPQGGRADLYWNLDRATYTQNSESGLSTREPGEDGVYRIRYAYNGEVVEIPAADKQLVNYIDTMDCMGIVQDADGVIIDVVDPKTLATETARMFYVRSAGNGSITLNSSMAMNGMTMEIALADVTQIYDVAPNAEVPGAIIAPEDLQPMDSVTVYSNGLGEATHVYAISHPVESPVYWRADTGMYDSTLKQTKRTPDENGYYTIPFYVNGEYVELKCNIQGIVNTIDNKNRFKAHTGLVLDENGYIVDNMLAATGIRGLLGCETYDVIEVNGSTFTAEAQISGKMDQYTKTLAADAKIYDVSLAAKPDVRGKAVDSLKIGDRIVTFENTEGEVILVFVAHRLVDSQMYFNVTKKYSSANKSTTREPVGGWYTIEMMDEEGKIKTYKTQDKAIVDKIDSQNNRSVALELDGDVITYVWEGECVAGYAAFVGYNIVNVTGSILSMAPSTNAENISNRIMTADCKVYNMSGKNKGETTTPQIGDYCIMWRNAKSEINYIYVIRRLVDAPMYFSVTRKWDSTKQETTRVPVDGWYIYECICEGKKVTVKTNSRETANFMDSQGPQTFALKVNSNNVVIEAYETAAITGGSKQYLNTIVKRLDVLVLYNPTNEKTYTPKLAEDCKIYNFSSAYEKARGERTTLQMNDNIQCYTNMKGEIAIILVRQRKVEADIYFSKTRIKTVDANGHTTREKDAEGWYVFECTTGGKTVTVKTKDIEIATMMDAQSPQTFALKVESNGVIKKAYETTSVLGGSKLYLNHDVTAINGKTVSTFYTETGKTYSFKMSSKCKVYNVSDNYDKQWGEATKLQVNDQIQCFNNSNGEVELIYVRKRPTETKMAWNVNPQTKTIKVEENGTLKDKKVTSRTPDANGYYTIDLAIDGKISSYKVLGEKAINYMETANGAIAVSFKNGVIISAQSAIYCTGVWTSTEAAMVATVKEINGNVLKISHTRSGETFVVDVTLSKNFVCYDVSGAGAFKGVAATPKVGNSGRMYLDTNKEVLYFYITSGGSSVVAPTEPELPDIPVYDNSNLTFAEGTTKALCTYCDKVVEWTALEAVTASSASLEEGGHYYLAADMTDNKGYYNVKTACVHLNGHNITSTSRVFAVESGSANVLTVIGNGVVTGGNTSTATANVAGATISVRGNLNLIGGTYKHANSTLPTIIMARPQETMNIYEGVTIEGTEGVTGTNLYVMMGVVNMYGGEIKGGTATPNGTTGGLGDNIYLLGHSGTAKARAEFNMYGGLVDGGIYVTKTTESYKVSVGGDAVITEKNGGLTLDSNSGAVLSMVKLSENAKVYVTGDGVITVANPNAANYVNKQILPAAEGMTLKAESNVIVADGYVAPEPTPEANPVWVMAFMAEDAQYNSTDKVTTRTPDADGYYYVKLAVNGVVNTYKTTQRGVDKTGNGIDYADQTGAKGRPFVIYLTDTDSFEFTKAMAAINNLPNSVAAGSAYNGTVASVEGNTVTLTNDAVATLAADVQVFDVSDATYGATFGAATQLTAGDTYISYMNSDNQLTYVYIKTRTAVVDPEPTPDPVPTWVLAWVVEPQYDSSSKRTTRTPDADGYYYVEMSVNGETKTYKTKVDSKEITDPDATLLGIDYVDQSGAGNRPSAICLTDVNSTEFTVAVGATNNTGAKGAKVTTVTAIENGVITGTGAAYTGKVAETGKIFDVSPNATVEGEITELRVGDYARFYTDANGDVLYGYVYTRTAVVEPEPEPTPGDVDMSTVYEKANAMATVFANGGEVEAECPACGKTVTWKPMPVATTSKITLDAGHYYFESDVTANGGYYAINDGATTSYEVCIHLNGKTFANTGTGNSRSFYADTGEKLTIMGAGNIVGARGTTTEAERCGSTLEVVGQKTLVNVCGGTWSKTSDKLDVMGCRAREDGSINVYDGTEINIGEVQGNAFWAAGGYVNLLGGVINGDVYARTYTEAGAKYETALKLTLNGVTVNGKVIIDNSKGAPLSVTLAGDTVIKELVCDSTLPVQIGRMTKGADVKVNATAAFTASNANLQDYVDAGFISSAVEGKIVTVTDGVASLADAPAPLYDNANLVFEEGTTKALCTYCGEVKEWTALEAVTGGSLSLAEGGHYYLAADMTENKGYYNIKKACVHLNGHNITSEGRAFAVDNGSTNLLTIIGNGTVTGASTVDSTANVAGATISCRGNLNLIGGTYKHVNSTLPTIIMAKPQQTMNIYEGVTIEGTEGVTGTNLYIMMGVVNMYGGSIVGGAATPDGTTGGLGDNVFVHGWTGTAKARAELNMYGGFVDGGIYVMRKTTETFKMTVGGNAVVSAKNGGITLDTETAAYITLDGLKAGAEVYITAADGVISLENAKAADYLEYGYIKAAAEGKTITEANGVLSIG
ncbi:MAG: hypothetical protein IKU07_00265 [Oscillospiraceae bacterium]|nr:hypothetical protein [Oscillospiraceae bacterium]